MRSFALAALLLLATLVPAAHAEIKTGGAAPGGLNPPVVGQGYCYLVQTEPRTTTAPGRCDVTNVAVQGIHILRLRVTGEGHALAYADQRMADGAYYVQWGPLHCTASLVGLYRMCSLVVSGAATGLAATFDLHMLVDGPGRATYLMQLERVVINLP